MKRTEEIMEILAAYDLTGSFRNAAALVGCDHHTVARYVRLCAFARLPADRRRGVVVTRLRSRRYHNDPRGRAPFMNAQRARRARSVSNIARTAGASAAASVRVVFAQRVTSHWPSPIFSSREVIAQTHPDSRLWGNL